MGLGDSIKIKVAEVAAADLSKRAERGAFGAFVQRAYVATKGKKAAVGSLLCVITLAVSQFSPPWADSYVRYSAIASGVLAAIGFLDKARRNEPVFEVWFLEAFAAANAWVAAGSTAVLAFASGGMLDLIFPGHPGLADLVTVYATAATTATAFLSRLARASAAEPKE